MAASGTAAEATGPLQRAPASCDGAGTVAAVIEVRRLRDDPAYRAGVERKGAHPADVDAVLAAEEARRRAAQVADDARRRAKAASTEIGRSRPEDRPAKIAAAAALKEEVAAAEESERAAEAAFGELVLGLPNPADDTVPSGGEDDYEVVAEHGGRPGPGRYDHAELAERLGLIETEQASRMSGSRFAYIMGAAVQVQFALVQWMTQRLVAAGFVPAIPPVLVREDMMVDAGFFPTDRNQVYELPEDGLFLVGTSEVGLAGLHRGDRLDAASLPRRYVGYSTCFRREAGTYGRDTRGIFRVHQFDKLEMFSWTRPESSWEEFELIRGLQEGMVRDLDLPYRVINVAAGDLGAAAAKKYDVEVWLPSEGRYREITSCSNYLDYSARRLGTRYAGEDGSGLVHTLNGTACAISRTLVFLFEHHQTPDGGWSVPEVLRPWTGFDRVEPTG
jgi:seryl-tRNA synthetase